MTVDVRAIVSCSLGTLISGNISDSYVQGSGLILVQGAVEVSGLITPAIGTAVTFTYKINGGVKNLPRKLRVLSSFADPFRRTTRVQLGCLLTYLQSKKDEVKWEAFDDPANSGLTAADAEIITIPIRAASVMDKCLAELGIQASSNPLTNQFSIAEFDYSPGYVQILSDLLVSECYCGYLDYSETLQVFSLNQDGGTGPVVTSADILDIADINAGQLPGEAVTVSYSTLKLQNSTPSGNPAVTEAMDWTRSTTSSTSQIAISYTAPTLYIGSVMVQAGSRQQAVYSTLDTSEEYTTYDELRVRRSTLRINNTSYYGDKINVVKERQIEQTQTAVAVLGSVVVQFLEHGFLPPSGQVSTTVFEWFEYDDRGNQIKSVKETYKSEAYAWGSLSVPAVIYEPPLNNGAGSYVYRAANISLGSTFLEEAIVTETIVFGKFTKTITHRYGPWMNTLSGQQAIAEGRPSFTTIAQVEDYVKQLISGRYYLGSSISTEENASSTQTAPFRSEQINQANAASTGDPNNGWRTESTAELALALGSASAQIRVEFAMPYAPDDLFVRGGTAPNYTYSAVSSDAEAKAKAFGRVQNRLLLGNRSGMNLQLSALNMPESPFAPLVVQANGLSALYRTNGTNWTFSPEGLVVSTDALFWGAVGGTGSFWFPVAPGVTTLPTTPATNSTTITGTDASGNPVTIGTQTTMAVGGTVTPYNETVLTAPTVRAKVAVSGVKYALNLNTPITSTTKAKITVQPVVVINVGLLDVGFTGNTPTVSTGASAHPESLTVSVVGIAPSVTSGASVAVPAAAVSVAAVAPDMVGRLRKEVLIPAADITMAALVPGVFSGGSIAVPAVDVALAGAVPVVGEFDRYWSNVSLLLHMDGANNSTTFTDSSSTGLAITAVGNSRISTTQSKFSGASGSFDGTGDYLSASYSTAFDLLGTAFTFECWIYPEIFKSATRIAAAGGGSAAWNTTNGIHWLINMGSAGKVDLQYYTAAGATGIQSGNACSLNAWNHIAACVSGSTAYLAINGTLVSAVIGTPQRPSTNPTLNVCSIPGESGANNIAFQGYIDEMRITKGIARYTASFTPPTKAFANR